MKQNTYEVKKNVDKVLSGKFTGFLSSNIRLEVEKCLRKAEYDKFVPFEEAEKIILYSGDCPRVRLFQICCYKDDEIKHSSIMGSLYGLNIFGDMFGDIVKWKENFYVYLLDDICDLVISEFNFVGNVYVRLKEVPLDFLSEFRREYEKIELIVSSLRIDTVISKLIGCNRDCVHEKIRDNDILVNEVIEKKVSTVLKVGDVFSVRRYGKFCFREIVGRTKKDNFIIVINKYV